MDILEDMEVSKLSAKFFFKSELLLQWPQSLNATTWDVFKMFQIVPTWALTCLCLDYIYLVPGSPLQGPCNAVRFAVLRSLEVLHV